MSADNLLVAGWGLEMWDLASASKLMTLGEEDLAAAEPGGPETAAGGLEEAHMWSSVSCAGHIMAAGERVGAGVWEKSACSMDG